MKRRLGWGFVLLLLVILFVVYPMPATGQNGVVRRVHAPYFADGGSLAEMAIFWFGRITSAENHADVRLGYNDDGLYLRVAVFDRRIWYDTTPSPPDELTAWDAVTLLLDLEGNGGDAPDTNTYRFVAQYSRGARDNYQMVYQGDDSHWVVADVEFTTEASYRGSGGPNHDADNRGWVLTYHIPFDGLGFSDPPSQESIWGLAVILHDRDDAIGTFIPDKTWPKALDPDRSTTWGQLTFDVPAYSPSCTALAETFTIRHGLDGVVVPDADVGGGSICGQGLDFWIEWGETNYAGEGDFTIQNQADIADWPCFSKYYVTFPLDALAPGKMVLSSTLTLHKFSQAGEPGQAQPSLIQVFTVAEDWEEATLTWNNAPLAVENIAATWVDPVPFPGWPGTPFVWDVSGAVAEAYTSGTPLRLVLYDADTAYHSGKYFVSSDSTIVEGRPTLQVFLCAPMAMIHKKVQPAMPAAGQMITYIITLNGNGQPLTLTDHLPAQVSAPGPVQVWGGPAADYDPMIHRLTWTGSPDVGQMVTFTFPVTVQVIGPLAVSNTAVLTDVEGRVSTDTVTLIVDAYRIWLPLVFRDSKDSGQVAEAYKRLYCPTGAVQF